jgi:hypothetical protein
MHGTTLKKQNYVTHTFTLNFLLITYKKNFVRLLSRSENYHTKMWLVVLWYILWQRQSWELSAAIAVIQTVHLSTKPLYVQPIYKVLLFYFQHSTYVQTHGYRCFCDYKHHAIHKGESDRKWVVRGTLQGTHYTGCWVNPMAGVCIVEYKSLSLSNIKFYLL